MLDACLPMELLTLAGFLTFYPLYFSENIMFQRPTRRPIRRPNSNGPKHRMRPPTSETPLQRLCRLATFASCCC